MPWTKPRRNHSAIVSRERESGSAVVLASHCNQCAAQRQGRANDSSRSACSPWLLALPRSGSSALPGCMSAANGRRPSSAMRSHAWWLSEGFTAGTLVSDVQAVEGKRPVAAAAAPAMTKRKLRREIGAGPGRPSVVFPATTSPARWRRPVPPKDRGDKDATFFPTPRKPRRRSRRGAAPTSLPAKASRRSPG